MSEIVDDLLEEVEQLEESTQELESSVEKVNQQVKQAQKASDNANTDANLLVLEASKTAQAAAEQSHKAAQASIKQAEQFKAQALELNESNFNWRQSVRNAAKDLQTAKTSFAVMMGVAIVMSAIAIGVVSYQMYAMQKQQAQFKGEMLDIITTETTLLTKKITLKIDELAAVVETLSQQVSILNTATLPSAVQNQTTASPADNEIVDQIETAAIEKTTETEKTDPETPDDKMQETAAVTGNTDQAAVNTSMNEKAGSEKPDTTESMPAAINAMDNKAIADAVKPVIDEAISRHSHMAMQNAATKEELAKLRELVEKVIAQQQTLQKQIHASSGSKATIQDNASTTIASGLTDAQVKKLNGISWLIRKQSKTLEAIESRLGKGQQQSPATVSQELQALKEQQSILQQQIISMQKALQVLLDKAKNPEPYSYKAK